MMQLVVMLEKQLIRRYSLKEQPTITIGRNSKCDICLPDRTISNIHACVKIAREDCFLEDMRSTNGTYVNHQLIDRYLLENGDIISVGKYQIKFECPESIDSQVRRVSIHPKLLQDDQEYWLHILNGRKTDHLIPLFDHSLVLGNEETGEVMIEYQGPDKYVLHNKTNPDKPIVHLLLADEEFEVAETLFRFCVKSVNA